jgi:hypothetical protein
MRQTCRSLRRSSWALGLQRTSSPERLQLRVPAACPQSAARANSLRWSMEQRAKAQPLTYWRRYLPQALE